MSRRLRQIPHLKDETYRDETLISNAEYQVFLNSQRQSDVFYQPDHWMGDHFLIGQGSQPILGVRYSDATAFCNWLTTQQSSVWNFRLPKEDECQTGGQNFFAKLSEGTGYWIDGETTFFWGNNGNPSLETLKGEQTDQCRLHIFELIRYLDHNLDKIHDLDTIGDEIRGILSTHAKTLRPLDPKVAADIDINRILDTDFSLVLDFALNFSREPDFIHRLTEAFNRASM
ncbi:MAG: hypothetical protein NVS4B11_32520 [Ktedonobacteraceae bacterium]